MKRNPLPYANEENQKLGNWLLGRIDGRAMMSQAKNFQELEKLVLAYAKKKGSIAGMPYFAEDFKPFATADGGLGWVTFGDLFEEVKSRM